MFARFQTSIKFNFKNAQMLENNLKLLEEDRLEFPMKT